MINFVIIRKLNFIDTRKRYIIPKAIVKILKQSTWSTFTCQINNKSQSGIAASGGENFRQDLCKLNERIEHRKHAFQRSVVDESRKLLTRSAVAHLWRIYGGFSLNAIVSPSVLPDTDRLISTLFTVKFCSTSTGYYAICTHLYFRICILKCNMCDVICVSRDIRRAAHWPSLKYSIQRVNI